MEKVMVIISRSQENLKAVSRPPAWVSSIRNRQSGRMQGNKEALTRLQYAFVGEVERALG